MRKKLWYLVKYTCLLAFLEKNGLVMEVIVTKYMFHGVMRKM